jgi:pimeloyl-ACP methyl ester carboxylesterase
MILLRKILRGLATVLVVLTIIYLLGPSPAKPVYNQQLPQVPADATSLEAYIRAGEAVHKLRPNNEARIVWYNDSLRQPTEYAIVYLHGFSASQEEGAPVHRTLAKTFGCNLYLSRLAEHGLDTTEQLVRLTADAYWESAKQALAIGLQLGKKIILVGTSTGGTQALQLAAAYPQQVAGLLLYSPNIAVNNDKAWLLNNPWGLQIARLVTGSDYVTPKDQRPLYKQYWNHPYRLEAVVELQEMLETSMLPQTFASIKQPVLMLYYYKDAQNQDAVVRVDAMQQMFEQLGTPAAARRAIAVPNAGDHVIGSYIKSQDVASVLQHSRTFLQEVMQLPVQQQLAEASYHEK